MAEAGKPKVVYFDIQGRAQSIRYLLIHKNVDFEDVRLTQEEWGAAKAAGTYTAPGGSLPSFIEADGTKKNQQMAILNYLAVKHGAVAATPEEEYEQHWFFETGKDHEKKDLVGAIFNEGAPEETVNAFIDNIKALFDKLDERWADGRVHVAGASITAADYYVLTGYTSLVCNTNLRNPAISAALKPHAESKQNYMRVVNSIKAEL